MNEPARAQQVADMAVMVPVPRVFSYLVPAGMRVDKGLVCICPFHGRRELGVVLEVRDRRDGDPAKLRALEADEQSLSLPAGLTDFLVKLARYYAAPVGEALALALPPRTRALESKLKEPTLFDEPSRALAARKVRWVRATSSGESTNRRGAARALLAYVRSVSEIEVARLEDNWKNARAVVTHLAADGLLEVFERERSEAAAFSDTIERDQAPSLRAEQADAVDAIVAALRARSAAVFLLQGVTGSGKTEVYLHAIAQALEADRGTIMLVPEIALTPQLVVRFRARFGDDVAVLHSALTARERFGMWRRLHAGEVKVAIGARSALFAPVRDLGLVVVDEEHDSSFKQEEGVRYHARDMAILRAHLESAVCVLGSATPSLESVELTHRGMATRLLLRERARAQPLPKVELIDMRRVPPAPGGEKKLSLTLHRALVQTLAEKEQAILFLNRRGFSPSARCLSCGVLVECPHCSVAMTYHKRRDELVCHYCDYHATMSVQCASCAAPAIDLEGVGTEKLQETLTSLFPEARIERLDRDVASGKEVEKILGRMRSGDIDILVGTQMVTKGHDLPNVTLVGVINADAALSIPDFRAEERAFQLLVQVAGRAGRGDRPGRVLVQTYAPESPVIQLGVRHDVAGFQARELAERRASSFPPFVRLLLVRVESLDEGLAVQTAQGIERMLRSHGIEGLTISPPSAAPLAKLRNYHRHRLLLRARERAVLRRALGLVRAHAETLSSKVKVLLDVDPVQLL